MHLEILINKGIVSRGLKNIVLQTFPYNPYNIGLDDKILEW